MSGLSRRRFLAAAGTAALAGRLAVPASQPPPSRRPFFAGRVPRHHHVTPSPMRAGPLPGYLYPTQPGWTTLLGSSGKLPSLVILNPASGAGPWNSDFETLAVNLYGKGIATIIGYIHTQYGAASITTMEAEVGNYVAAGITPGVNGVTGIFIDEFPNAAGSFSYYSTLCSSIQSQFAAAGMPNPVIWANPGTAMDSSYLALPVTTFMTVEWTLATYNGSTPWNVLISGSGSDGSATEPRSRFCHLVYDSTLTGAANINPVVDRAWQHYAGWVWTTTTNDYSVIPSNSDLDSLCTRAAAEPV